MAEVPLDGWAAPRDERLAGSGRLHHLVGDDVGGNVVTGGSAGDTLTSGEGGDTLNRIAQRYGVTVEAIMQANGFTDRNRILRIGERLVIPDTLPGSPVPR